MEFFSFDNTISNILIDDVNATQGFLDDQLQDEYFSPNIMTLSESTTSQSHDDYLESIDISALLDDDVEEMSVTSVITIGDIYNKTSFITCDTKEERDMLCVATSLAMVNRWLPIDIYYKVNNPRYNNQSPFPEKNTSQRRLGKGNNGDHVHIAQIFSININRQRKNGDKRSYMYMFGIRSLKKYEGIFEPGASLSNAARLAREYFVNDGKDVKLNGWRVFKYRTQEGKYKSLLNLFTRDMRLGLALPTCIRMGNVKIPYSPSDNISNTWKMKDELYALRMPALSLCPPIREHGIDHKYYEKYRDIVDQHKHIIFN